MKGDVKLVSDLDPDLRAEFDALLKRAQDSGSADALAEYARACCARETGTGSKAASVRAREGAPGRFGMIGASPAMNAVFELIARVAPTDVSVLIQGETGSGKELVARALHESSPRHSKRLMAENCAAVPENLLESELFGHAKGSFTGAIQDREGHFVVADGGTVFLDEIGDMPLSMQAKLLRVLQDGEVRPVGSNKSKKVDVRLVAATHRDLVEAVGVGAFRQDLLFRLNVVTIYLPPLREREGDVRLLVTGLLPGIAAEVGREAELDESALAALEAWDWPGNVRELENELRRAVALSDGVITSEDLSQRIRDHADPSR